MKGLELNEAFYKEKVVPIMGACFPDVLYSAALLGWGSEVLGYDDDLSADHNWGLRFQLFLSQQDYGKYHNSINQILSESLPNKFLGLPTNFDIFVNPDQRAFREANDIKHNIDIETIEGFFGRYLGLKPFEK